VKTEAQANSSSKSATTEADPENVSRLTELITLVLAGRLRLGMDYFALFSGCCGLR
jgi:hypothetical protein